MDDKLLVEHLSRFITQERFEKFRENIQNRTRYITIVLEDIFQPHNASAVLRTCDCFGLQDVHIIENHNKYQVNPDVALGSSKWLTLQKYNGNSHNTVDCLKSLKDQGYHLVATTPHKNDFSPENLPLDRKTALIFGTELQGLTDEALSMADDYVRIPMFGFTESLNISVSAAILIHTLTERLKRSEFPWQLSDSEKDTIVVDWLKNSISKSDSIIRELMKRL